LIIQQAAQQAQQQAHNNGSWKNHSSATKRLPINTPVAGWPLAPWCLFSPF
jgi:hypothetical protein